MKNKISKKLRQKRGASMGEMLATLVLVGYVSILVCMGVLAAYKRTNVLYQAAYRDELGALLLTRIEEELTDAINDPEKAAKKSVLYVTSESAPAAEADREGNIPSSAHKLGSGNQIVFRGSQGIRTRIYINQDRKLEIWYQGFAGLQADTPDSYWTFDEKTYHGFDMKSLDFTILDSVDDKVYIRIGLELEKSGDTESVGSYERTTCCRMLSRAAVGGEV